MSDAEQNILQEHIRSPSDHAMPCSLPDLLHIAPQIVQLLRHNGLSALSACSRQLRQLVQHVTLAVHLPSIDDVGLLSKYKRAQLSVVFFQNVTVNKATINNSLMDAGLQVSDVDSLVHTYIVLSKEAYHLRHNPHAMLLMLDTTQGQPHQLACSAEQTLAGMSEWTHSWQWLYVRVLVAPNKGGARGIAALLARLRHVRMLDLAMACLNRAGVEQLVDARQQFLQVLNISNNKLDADSVRLLAHSSWPRFEEIDLSNNQLDCQTLAHLFTAGWQLTVRYIAKAHSCNISLPPCCVLTCMLSVCAFQVPSGVA